MTTLRVEIFQCDVPNRNNRIYTRQVAEQIIEQQKNKPEGTLMGEIVNERQYPSSWPPDNSVPLDRVSHTVANLRLEGDYLVGDATILSTPQGEVLEKMITDPNLKFIQCGIGNITPEGVVSDFHIRSVDAWRDHSTTKDHDNDVADWHNEGGQ